MRNKSVKSKISFHSWLSHFFIPLLLTLLLFFSYTAYGKTNPVSYWDEVQWVGRSYFFEFFIRGDLKNRVWQSFESYDQPKFAEYSYGVWLYPLYLRSKSNQTKSSDYTQFLIKNGFYEIDESYLNTYAGYRKKHMVMRIDERMSGFSEDWRKRYGEQGLKIVNLIYSSRILSTLLLTGAVIWAYFLALYLNGLVFAIIFSILYGYNLLLIEVGIKAHSEALFLFTFNAALFWMIFYFTKGRRSIYLLLFSLFAGLCLSTKLNGLVLSLVFFVTNLLLIFSIKRKDIKKYLEYILVGFTPLLQSIIIFIILNPFLYPNLIKNIKYMYESRITAAHNQQKNFPETKLLNNKIRLKKIFENYYFSKQASYYNGVKIIGPINLWKNYGQLLHILFFIGFLSFTKQALEKNVTAIVMLASTVIVILTSPYYLLLDWDRYYAPLSLFFILIQTLGINYLVLLGKNISSRFVRT